MKTNSTNFQNSAIGRRAFVVFPIFLIGCNIVESDKKGLEELNNIESKWQDSLRVASSTSRIALSGPLMQMQSIKRELDSIYVSSCLKEAKKSLAEHMEKSISAFLSFMQGNEKISEEMLRQARLSLRGYQGGISVCSGEAPSVGAGKLNPMSPNAMALNYTMKSTKPGRECGKCTLYQGGKNSFGNCPLFADLQVAKEGVCSAWAPRS
jgi:hypothetical protein